MKNRSFLPLFILNFICLGFLYLFTSLGIWQIHRLKWKQELIAQTNSRLENSPILAPAKAEWPKFDFGKLAYLPVTVSGQYLANKKIYVTSLTKYGSGYWLMMPLQRADGSLVFINRGFVPMDFKNSPQLRQSDLKQPTNVTGLLRPDEGPGRFLNKNKPELNSWYKRDLKAMAQKLQLGPENVAPYFIDAEKLDNAYPIGGLTVVSFPNSHFSYAITWFVLAFGVFGAIIFININEYKQRRS